MADGEGLLLGGVGEGLFGVGCLFTLEQGLLLSLHGIL